MTREELRKEIERQVIPSLGIYANNPKVVEAAVDAEIRKIMGTETEEDKRNKEYSLGIYAAG